MTDVKTQVLTDKSATGRDRPWERHKTSCEYLAAAYDDIDERKAERVRGCAVELTFAVDEAGNKKLDSAWFCRVRLCPMCSWRRSLRVGAQMNSIMNEIAKGEQPYKYLMLTLTMKNVEGAALRDGLDHLMRSFDRMFKRKRVRDAVKGWYRAVEITHNLTENEYHPHIHCVLAVTPAYFGRGYIKQAEWVEMWQRALKVSYEPNVDIRTIKGNMTSAVAEIAKYAVKSDDYIIPTDWDLTLDTIQLLDSVLAGRRFIGFGGIFKEIQRKLKLADPEDEQADLVHIDGEAPSGAGERRVTFVWYSGYRQYIQALD